MEEEKNQYGFFFGWNIDGRPEEPPKRKIYFDDDVVMRAWEQIDATCIFRYFKTSIFLDTLEPELSAEQKCRR